MPTALRNARMELRTSETIKELITRAASLDGTDLTAFVLESAIKRARKVVLDHASLTISHEGQLNLAKALKSPSKPTAAMKKLMSSTVLIVNKG